MATYTTQRQLNAYEITVTTLGKLEKYILNDLPSKLELDEDEVHQNYSITLTYEPGNTITLNTIEEFRGNTFEDALQSISLTLKTFTFSITFGEKRSDNKFRVSTTGNSKSEAKEKGNAVYGDIESILRGQEKQSITLLHNEWRNSSSHIFLVLLASLLIINNTPGIEGTPSWVLPYSIGIIAVGLAIMLLRQFHPYAWFKSKKNDRLKKVDNFLLWGIPISVIGGLIATGVIKIF